MASQIVLNGLSPDAIELLLFLRRSPDTFWSAEAASQRLDMDPRVASSRLAELAAEGLLTRGTTSGAYRYAPKTESLRILCDQLAVGSTSRDRLRAFSDAFKLK